MERRIPLSYHPHQQINSPRLIIGFQDNDGYTSGDHQTQIVGVPQTDTPANKLLLTENQTLALFHLCIDFDYNSDV